MMRFPKTLKSLPELYNKQEPLIPEAIPSFLYPNINHNIFEMTQINFAQNTLKQHQDSQRIMHMLQMVHLSLLEMLKLNKRFQQNEEIIESLDKQLDSLKETYKRQGNFNGMKKYSGLSSTESCQEDGLSEASSNPLTDKLFGKQQYRYRLQVQGPVENFFVKEKNFNLTVQMVDLEGQKVMNSNIIHLCLGVIDAQGEWVTQSSTHQDILKGKTELQIYHGQATFVKLYFREISRKYAGGRFNFVVYAKPSIMKFINNNTVIQRDVDSSEIEPLIISDVLVRSKKHN